MDKLVIFLAEAFCKLDNWLIIIFAIINGYVLVRMMLKLKKANEIINPTSDKRYKVNASMEWNNEEISKLAKMRTSLVSGYAWYANLTAIFPLLGILGTVAALVTYSADTMMDSFMVALGTTLLGVFFAIIFKFLDALISGPLEVFIEDADHIIQHFDE